jgi:hypothetical protein
VNLLFTGRGGNGSWTVRGEQVGAALGATVKPKATRADFDACDAAVVVKRVPDALLKDLRASGKPWAFDCVDFYPQPASAAWGPAESIKWVMKSIDELDPTAVLWPNERMRRDCDNGDRPGFVLRHHARPQQLPNPIREKVRRVGYEGRPDYLGEFLYFLDVACRRRGWEFVVNPSSLSEIDIVVAFRNGRWDSYSTKHWKSNVKLANAHATGTPFIGQPDDAYQETATGCEYWALNAYECDTCFDWLEAQSTREQVSDRFKSAAYTVEQAAADLKPFLSSLR